MRSIEPTIRVRLAPPIPGTRHIVRSGRPPKHGMFRSSAQHAERSRLAYAPASPIYYRPGWRPDMVREGQVLESNSGRSKGPSLASTGPRHGGHMILRDQQYHAIHLTRLRLVLRSSPRVRSLRQIARITGAPIYTISRVFSGRYMPTFGLGLAIAHHLGMDPATFYAWCWERQQERAFWFPAERPRHQAVYTHPRPSITFITPRDKRLSPKARCAPMEMAPPDLSRRPPKGHNAVPPGAFDWRNYRPMEDPVYLRVMRHLAQRGVKVLEPRALGQANRAVLAMLSARRLRRPS